MAHFEYANRVCGVFLQSSMLIWNSKIEWNFEKKNHICDLMTEFHFIVNKAYIFISSEWNGIESDVWKLRRKRALTCIGCSQGKNINGRKPFKAMISCAYVVCATVFLYQQLFFFLGIIKQGLKRRMLMLARQP